MKANKLIFAVSLLLLQTGCSEFYGFQSPAPVYDEPPPTNPYEHPQVKTYPDKQSSKPDAIKSSPTSEIQSQSMAMPTYQARSQPPAVVALMSESDRNQRAGDLDSAVASLERALRIDPRNPTLTYKLAELRLKQEKPRLAEDLAKKSALLAAGDVALKRKSWLLISEARRMQDNIEGAKEAKIKADNLASP